ncbi:thiol reductant ABC exporter subunit CydD [Xanthobacter agilis]|uniref:ATP-binding cassette subfamily C protein CydD n=1 Tax=Xanthobacter agilis TaxID=47492 RepID=A0ABU0L8H3_XANAG|nr:thiol reductant ABC exporter subunit CydD [Xanthobacter agilis]MDQ0503403.1 ATP-binding cassette subfamily C protein CydD [Xanthobacter agilis]
MPPRATGGIAISTPSDLDQKPDKKRLSAFLSRFRGSARRDLNTTLLLSVATGLIIIVQAFLVARILNGVLFQGRPALTFTPEITGLVAAMALRFATQWGTERFGFAAASRVMRAMRAALVDRVEAIGPVGLAETRTGDLVAALAEGVRAVEPYYARYIPASVLAVALPVAILVVVFPLDWISGLVFLLTAPLIPVFMIFIGKGAERLNQKQWRRLARMSGHLLDAVQGLATLKAFNAAGRMAAQVAAVADGYRRDTMAVLRIAFLSSLVLEFFATVSIAMVAVFIGFRLLWGEMDFFTGLFVLLLAPEFYAPLRAMGTAYHARMEALGAAERMVALEDVPALAEPGGTTPLPSPERIEVRFEDVHLTFADGRTALDGISFTLAPGETVALVGPSGAGKSSLIHLLLGFVAPTSGRVLVNGVPLSALDMAQWRRHIGYVPQRPRLFAGSLAANIAPGEAVPDPARLKRAVAQAGLSDVVAAVPGGLEGRVGETGGGLSGGEAHRLSVARAFYRDAPMVVLDEPTAHLDGESAAKVEAALHRLMPGRTGLIAAHRLASISGAHRIVVVNHGRIVEEGDAASLLAQDGLYARLATSGDADFWEAAQ